MIPSVKKSTKSFDMERQEINEVIGHVPGEHDALAAGTSSDVLAAAQATNSFPRCPPRRGGCRTAGHCFSPPCPPTLHTACRPPAHQVRAPAGAFVARTGPVDWPAATAGHPPPHEIGVLPRGQTTSPPAAAWRRLPPARQKAGGPPI